MSKKVSLIVGLGLAVALSVSQSAVKAQLSPPPGQGEPTPEDKKAKQKANEGQPPAKGAQPPGAPGRGPGDRPRGDAERQGPQPGAPGRGPGDRPRGDTERQGPRPGQEQRPPEAPPRVQQPRPPEAPPRAQQPRPPEATERAQTPPEPPKKDFLPKSSTVPQMKPRPDQSPPGSPPQASPSAPKGVNERMRPGQPAPVEGKGPVATPQAPPVTPDAPKGAANRNPAQPVPVVPNAPVATPQTTPGTPAAPTGTGNRAGTDPRAPGQPATEGVSQRPGAPVTTAPPAALTPQANRTPPPAVSQIPTAVLPAAPKAEGPAGGFRPGFQPAGPPVQSLSEIQKGRTQRVEAGGKRTIIQENDNRIIIRQDNRTIIRHDETQRFARNATDVRSQRRPDGTTQTVIIRPGGVQLFSVVDNSGRVLRRYRRDDRGREINIIDNRRFYRNAGIGLGVGLAIGAVALALRPPEVRIDRAKYIVDYERASDDDIYEALSAAPIERLERRYSLDEVRFSNELRNRMRRVDLDTITFEFGSWDVGQEQFPKLERVAKVISRITSERPSEVFLIEGHTDAVGSDVDNLTLSDRRAQAVAEILSSAFNVPPENLVTQGYGEQHLKIPTQDAERQNRRVAVRRITPLMSESNR